VTEAVLHVDDDDCRARWVEGHVRSFGAESLKAYFESPPDSSRRPATSAWFFSARP
jgi:hypothetical protein